MYTPKQIIIIGVIFLALIGGIKLLGVLGDGTGFSSSSPSATVKEFFNALNKGDISKAESYLAPGKEIGDIGLFSGIINGNQKREEAIKFLAGKIKKVEIEGKGIESAFGSKEAVVVYKIIIKSDAEAEAEEIKKIVKDDPGSLRRRFSEKVYFENCWLVSLDGKEGTYYLQEWDGKWKIFSY